MLLDSGKLNYIFIHKGKKIMFHAYIFAWFLHKANKNTFKELQIKKSYTTTKIIHLNLKFDLFEGLFLRDQLSFFILERIQLQRYGFFTEKEFKIQENYY